MVTGLSLTRVTCCNKTFQKGLLSMFNLFLTFYLPKRFSHTIDYLLANSLPLPEAVNRSCQLYYGLLHIFLIFSSR